MTRRGVILFLALGVAWGIPYLLIKVAVGELEPAMVVLGRTTIGALILLPIALWRRQVLVVLRRWKPLIAYTIVEIVIPWTFLSSAETRLPSSTSGLLLAAVPIVGVIVAILMGRPERLGLGNVLGMLLGTIGVAALVGLDVAGSDLVGVAEMAVVAVGYAVGPAILARWMSDLPGLGVVTVSLALAAVIAVPIVLLAGALPTSVPSAPVIGSIVGLGLICSAVAFLLMFALIGEVGPVRATTITYLNPAVAIAAGALVLHERITVWTIVGFVLVLAGSFLVTRRRAAVPPEPEAVPAVK
ncbi:DMT family transporter [Schumannella sp. 10F1B-5-1]|uniref:DMT family transporter n=1 Tax=Schumannella sp. 10F1B-5-1 TaxID=2590780 RepID=UPI001130FFF6|nr:DMT family transporter [Schumannella sp. 10F1B-5-1]TPW73748.1 DMT family transporter [Schumannella sp. 10F1B-5-1]